MKIDRIEAEYLLDYNSHIKLHYALVEEVIERVCKTLDTAMEEAYSHEKHLTGLPLEIIDEDKRYGRDDMRKYWEQKGWKSRRRDDILERSIQRDYFSKKGEKQ